MIAAVVSLQEAVDLLFVAGVVSFGSLAFGHLRRKDQLRRIARKERQAEFQRKRIRAERERSEAMRYFGTGARL